MIDLEAVVASGLLLFPPQAGHSQRMTRTLAHCGPSPLIKLQAAALRTGEEMVNDRISALTQPLTF